MTDHLERAAAKAVELASLLTTPTDLDDTLRVGAAAHLTYLAGLIRGQARCSGRVQLHGGPVRLWGGEVIEPLTTYPAEVQDEPEVEIAEVERLRKATDRVVRQFHRDERGTPLREFWPELAEVLDELVRNSTPSSEPEAQTGGRVRAADTT